MCKVPVPRAGALVAADTSFLSAQQSTGASSKVGWEDALSSPQGRGSQLAYPLGDGAVMLKQVMPAHAASKEQHGDTGRLDAPGEGISSRDDFAMVVLSPTLGEDGQLYSRAHCHLPEPQTAATFKPHMRTSRRIAQTPGTGCRECCNPPSPAAWVGRRVDSVWD